MVPSQPVVVGVDDSGLEAAVSCLKNKGVLIYPTDTVLGLGGDARLPSVSERVRVSKGHHFDKPLLLLADDWSRVSGWIQPPDQLLRKLMMTGSRAPLTILFEPTRQLPDGLRGNSRLIGVRVTDHPIVCRLVAGLGAPITSTSANLAGLSPARNVSELAPDLRASVDLILDGPTGGEVPSTVVSSEDGEVRIVREGGLSGSDLRRDLRDR